MYGPDDWDWYWPHWAARGRRVAGAASAVEEKRRTVIVESSILINRMCSEYYLEEG
jgi:hypothetical protein